MLLLKAQPRANVSRSVISKRQRTRTCLVYKPMLYLFQDKVYKPRNDKICYFLEHKLVCKANSVEKTDDGLDGGVT